MQRLSYLPMVSEIHACPGGAWIRYKNESAQVLSCEDRLVVAFAFDQLEKAPSPQVLQRIGLLLSLCSEAVNDGLLAWKHQWYFARSYGPQCTSKEMGQNLSLQVALRDFFQTQVLNA